MVPLLVVEERSGELRQLLEDDPAGVAWWGTRLEVVSAVRRRERDGLLGAEEVPALIASLRDLMMSWVEVAPSTRVAELAERALAFHPLRAGDALQLAAALTWTRGMASGEPFCCLDDRLRAAASREGFALVPS